MDGSRSFIKEQVATRHHKRQLVEASSTAVVFHLPTICRLPLLHSLNILGFTLHSSPAAASFQVW